MSIKISNCLVALYSFSTTSGRCIANFAGPQTWSVNPFSYSSVYPITGEVQLCGEGTISVNVPIVMGNRWSLVGCGSGIAGGGVWFQASAANFQPTYTTGTITAGTAGRGEVITGSGTTFTSSMIGCAFVSPATQPTVTNHTYGIISAVTSATSITLGFGANNGTGAPAASGFAIYCPLVLQGDGNVGSQPYEFGMRVEHLYIDCNNVAGCVALMNWFGEEGTTAEDDQLTGFTNIGLDIETGYADNSGPYNRVNIGPGSSCTAATIDFVSRTGFSGMKPFENASVSSGSCSTLLTVGIDFDSSYADLYNLHLERLVNGISIGANVSCPVACPSTPNGVSGVSISDIFAAVSGTTVVAISNAIGNSKAVGLYNIAYSFGLWTNSLTDAQNSCTDPSSVLGTYEINDSGTIQNSSAYTTCPASPVLGQTYVRSVAPSAGSTISSPKFHWGGYYSPSTGVTSLHDVTCQLVENSGVNAASSMQCSVAAGTNTGYLGWVFDGVITPLISSIYSAAGTPLPTCNTATNGGLAFVKDATYFEGPYVSGGSYYARVYCGYNGSFGWQMQSGANLPTPTISSGFGTSATVPNNSGPTSFSINVGTGGSASSGVIGLPAAQHGWACFISDGGTTPTGQTEISGPNTTTTVTVTNYSRTTGLAIAWTASEVLEAGCKQN
jgi:hypothetical protein